MDSRSFAAPSALAAAVLAFGSGGMVRCLPARQPAAAASLPGGAETVDRARLFAPTRQAVFFSRSGDRCALHGGGPVRG